VVEIGDSAINVEAYMPPLKEFLVAVIIRARNITSPDP
jgi:hypothetical protein